MSGDWIANLWGFFTPDDPFLSSIVSNIFSGILLAVLFFFAKEKLFGLSNITGRWFFQTTTQHTAYKPFEGMVLRYIAILGREGTRIAGTIEKVYERSSTGERQYVGENRTRGTVEGYYEKRIFSKDRVHLHVTEDGHGRTFTLFYALLIERNGSMIGNFVSTAGDQEGDAQWQRNPF
jgi:hypothetical protein